MGRLSLKLKATTLEKGGSGFLSSTLEESDQAQKRKKVFKRALGAKRLTNFEGYVTKDASEEEWNLTS
ncbi:hypothetical protein TrLO_g5162 [Triparma laevis f. longispina]|uniref:Uncharacterized protein n=1 Tax=Triparma laevis f. longispina TaxID=1714387 RepID=A0A9W7KU45_9STRA|nr:hypothetical protein TrLO_g5162 [Triparma laevis f. longispina]